MSETISLVYIHLNDPLRPFPNYLYDTIYQSYLIHASNPVPVYILTHTGYIQECKDRIALMNIPCDAAQFIHIIPLETLHPTLEFRTDAFASTFFVVTFQRFIYLAEWMKHSNITRVFHIENDVMVYTHINHLYKLLCAKAMETSLVVVQDAPIRALGSIVFVPTYDVLTRFLAFAINYLKTSTAPTNEMILLGLYSDKESFPNTLEDSRLIEMGYYDGAALGQYLGGVDTRNLTSRPSCVYDNPSVGFINETSLFKPNMVKTTSIHRSNALFDRALRMFVLAYGRHHIPVHTLHIHSKQLYLFSSDFRYTFNDLICVSGLRKMCSVYIVGNKVNVDDEQGMRTLVITNTNVMGTNVISHLHDSKSTAYICGAHTLNILPTTNETYTWNLNVNLKHVQLLPRGTDDPESLFEVMTHTYYNRKTEDIFVYIDKSFSYHDRVINILTTTKTARVRLKNEFSRSKYLHRLAQHRFALCVRGNSIDTTQFWEALYLRTIPVIINNKHTQMKPFISHLKHLGIPFFEIHHFSEFCRTHDDIFFSDSLYNRIMAEHPHYEEKLKLDYYK